MINARSTTAAPCTCDNASNQFAFSFFCEFCRVELRRIRLGVARARGRHMAQQTSRWRPNAQGGCQQQSDLNVEPLRLTNQIRGVTRPTGSVPGAHWGRNTQGGRPANVRSKCTITPLDTSRARQDQYCNVPGAHCIGWERSAPRKGDDKHQSGQGVTAPPQLDHPGRARNPLAVACQAHTG